MSIIIQDTDSGIPLTTSSFMVATRTTDVTGSFSVDLSEYGFTRFLGVIVTPIASGSLITDALGYSVNTATPTSLQGKVFKVATGALVGAGVTVYLSILLN